MKNRFTNELELLQGINEKNKCALNQFLTSLHAKATAIANTVVKDDHIARQLVHDAHLAFIEISVAFESLEKAQNYFYTSARNAAQDYIRSAHYKNWKNLTQDLPEIRDDTNIHTGIVKKEIHKEILAIMETFPEKYQCIYNLWYTGHTTNAVASQIGEDAQYVRNTRNKIFKKILKILKLKNLIMLF